MLGTAGAKTALPKEKSTAVRLLESGMPLTKVAQAFHRSWIVLWKWKVVYAKEEKSFVENHFR